MLYVLCDSLFLIRLAEFRAETVLLINNDYCWLLDLATRIGLPLAKAFGVLFEIDRWRRSESTIPEWSSFITSSKYCVLCLDNSCRSGEVNTAAKINAIEVRSTRQAWWQNFQMSNMAENTLFSTEPKKGSNKQGQLDSEKEFGK